MNEITSQEDKIKELKLQNCLIFAMKSVFYFYLVIKKSVKNKEYI